MSAGVTDAVLDLGCQLGASPSSNNASLINGGFTSAAHQYGICIPSGYLKTTESIVIPAKAGYQLVGQGSCKDGHDAHTQIGKPSKIVSEFSSSTGKIIVNNSGHASIKHLALQGRPVAGSGGDTEPSSEAQARAQVGIQIPTYSTTGLPGSKCFLDDISFYQIGTGILVGDNLDNIGADSYTGHDGNNADTIYAGTLHFYHHAAASGSVNANTGRSVHIRNLQSVDNYFQRICTHGDPENIVYVERGGRMTFGQIISVGTAGGTTIMLRVGKIDLGQFGINVMQMNIDGTTHKLLKMDSLTTPVFSTPRINIWSANIPEGNNAVPQLDCQPGVTRLHNAGYLKAGSIKLTGKLSGSEKLVCHVHLENCILYAGVTPATLIDGASSGAYVLTWKNCQIYHDGASPKIWGRPITDGEIVNSVTRVTL